MAEAAVGVLIGKIGAALAKGAETYGASLLCREASSLKGLFWEIHKAERELESMHAYLRESENFKDIDETMGIFLERVPQIISSWLQLKSLTKLSLISSKLDEVSFSSLMGLCDLCFLELVQAYDGKKLYFSEAFHSWIQKHVQHVQA